MCGCPSGSSIEIRGDMYSKAAIACSAVSETDLQE